MSEKYYRCRYIDNALDFWPNDIYHCCKSSHSGGKRVPLVENFQGEDIDWEQLFSIKNELKYQLYNGLIPQNCKGCPLIQEIHKDDLIGNSDNYIDIVQINHFKKCNSRCCYCSEIVPKENLLHNILTGFNEKLSYNIVDVFKDMFARNILRYSKLGSVVFGGGEPTLLKGFDELLNLCYQNGLSRYVIHSSGIKHSDSVEKGLMDRNIDLDLIISIDAGTRDTYKKIKRVDCFKKVCANIKKYIGQDNKNSNKVRLKYIIVPGINDNLSEVDKWYELSTKELGSTSLIMDIEMNWFLENKDNMPDYILELIRHVKKRADQDNITLDYYEQAVIIKSLL